MSAISWQGKNSFFFSHSVRTYQRLKYIKNMNHESPRIITNHHESSLITDESFQSRNYQSSPSSCRKVSIKVKINDKMIKGAGYEMAGGIFYLGTPC